MCSASIVPQDEINRLTEFISNKSSEEKRFAGNYWIGATYNCSESKQWVWGSESLVEAG